MYGPSLTTPNILHLGSLTTYVGEEAFGHLFTPVWDLILAMTIHVFGDDRLPAGLAYDGQRSLAHLFGAKGNVHLDFSDDDSCVHRRLASYGFAI
jgi:hypothetical protein